MRHALATESEPGNVVARNGLRLFAEKAYARTQSIEQ
jgi:hypothetical protein